MILMLLGRVIAGMASGATTVVVPIYLGELAPPHLRGAFGVMFQLACVCALSSRRWAGYLLYWEHIRCGQCTFCSASACRPPCSYSSKGICSSRRSGSSARARRTKRMRR